MAGTRGLSRRAWTLAGAVALAGLVGAGLWLTPPEPAAPVVHVPTPAGTRLDVATPVLAEPSRVASPTPDAATPSERWARGAFGALPPLALPGELGPRPVLAYTRAPDLGPMPASADVYRLTWTRFTPETVLRLSQRLGLSGSVASLGPDTFQVDDRAQGRLLVAHGRIVYSRGGEPVTGSLAPDQAVELARQWLVERDLLPVDAGPPRAQPVPDLGLTSVIFTPRAPRGLLTPEPGLTVAIDGRGIVHDVDMLWPAEQQIASYPLAGVTAAWEAVQRGQGFVEVDAAAVPPDDRLTGRVAVTRASVGYALAGGTDATAPAYLEPVYIFSGLATLPGQAEPVPCRVYLPALASDSPPRA